MMKATVLLFVALAVTVNGLGFPNFNLGCPFAQANRFANQDALLNPNTLGVIPYCRVVDGSFVNDLSSQLVARTGYTPVYDAAPNWVIIRPEVPLSTFTNPITPSLANVAFPGIIVSVGDTAKTNLPNDMAVGTEIGFLLSLPAPLPSCTPVDTTRVAGASFGLGLSNTIACPWQSVLGHFEYANSAGGSAAGRAQALTLPRPYIFYGL